MILPLVGSLLLDYLFTYGGLCENRILKFNLCTLFSAMSYRLYGPSRPETYLRNTVTVFMGPHGVGTRVIGPSNPCVDTPGCGRIRHFNCVHTSLSVWLRCSNCSHVWLLVHMVQVFHREPCDPMSSPDTKKLLESLLLADQPAVPKQRALQCRFLFYF